MSTEESCKSLLKTFAEVSDKVDLLIEKYLLNKCISFLNQQNS